MPTALSLLSVPADHERPWIDGVRDSSAIPDVHALSQEDIPPTEKFVIDADDLAVLLGTDIEANTVDHLLHALAGSLAAVLGYFAAARGAHLTEVEPDENLREAVTEARKRLGLTKREAEVLTLLARGFTNREIAAELVISVRTAEHHVEHILRKLPAPNRRAAAAIAHRVAHAPALALAPESNPPARRKHLRAGGNDPQ